MSAYIRISFIILAVILASSISARAVEVLKIMPLGDSNTRGTYPVDEGGPHPAAIGAGGYRYPLQQMLTAGGYRFDFVGSQTSNAVGEQGNSPPDTWTYDPNFDPDHHGLAGFTNAKLISGGPVPTYPGDPVVDAPPLATCISLYQPDIVLLMSGTNSIRKITVENNLQDLGAVINTIITASPSTHVIVSTIFDRWKTTVPGDPAYAYLDTETQAYNAGIPSVVAAAQQQGGLVSFVDAGSALTLEDFLFDGVLLDGVHPNPLSLYKVAAVWYTGIQAVAPVPEPSNLVLAGIGMLLVAAYYWRKRKCRGE